MNIPKVNISFRKLKADVVSSSEEDGLLTFHYTICPDASAEDSFPERFQLSSSSLPYIRLRMTFPALGIIGTWMADSGFSKNLRADWAPGQQINLSHSAPVVCFFNGNDQNCLTLALSEAARDVLLFPGIHEENGEMLLEAAVLLSEPLSEEYHLSIRLDTRTLPFYESLKEVSNWWDSVSSDAPMKVPAEARIPMYSTWYSYHQDISDEALSREYGPAETLGMKAVIIDDGWQTSDNNRGYGYCGDWENTPDKFPDFAAHVQKIHSHHMKCLLWYSVPFIGRYSRIWNRFSEKLLHYDEELHCGTLDPRYPEVREYLVSVFEKGMKEWNLDGFKLDFIDSFRSYPDTPAYSDTMDYSEIQDAVYALMLEISRRLQKQNPSLLIEFRQNYIGPRMRRFGNIFRVGDCPLSGISNRVGITDLKLISGNTAVHSDMLMWHRDEKPEDVAIQLINNIFATLQISVHLNEQTTEQKKVLAHYLNFSTKYREVLQCGDFRAHAPLALYPLLESCKDQIWISASYKENQIIPSPDPASYRETIFLNGTKTPELTLRFSAPGVFLIRKLDCFGEIVHEETKALTASVHTFQVSQGGALFLYPSGASKSDVAIHS